jgi:hypothetical protein
MEVAPRRRQPWAALFNRRTLALTLAFIALMTLYVHSSWAMSPNAKPLLYQEYFVIQLSIYTYATVTFTHFMRRYRGRSRENQVSAEKETGKLVRLRRCSKFIENR